MTAKFECNFCGANCTGMIEAAAREPAPPGKHTAGICQRCGELLMVGRFSVRKPTDDEYTALGSDPSTAMARRVWLESKLSRRSRSSTLTTLDAVIDGLPEHCADAMTVTIVKGSALGGAASAIAEVRQLLDRCDGYDDFYVALTLLEAEINTEKTMVLSDLPSTYTTGAER